MREHIKQGILNEKVLLMDGQSKGSIRILYVDAEFELMIEQVCISYLQERYNMREHITNRWSK